MEGVGVVEAVASRRGVDVRRCAEAAFEGRWSFPSLTAFLLDQTRVKLGGELVAAANLIYRAPAPTSFT